MNKTELDLLIESWQPEMVEMLQSWVRIPSVKSEALPNMPFGRGVYDVLQKAVADANDMGFETKNFDNYACHIQYGTGDETMGILAHLDVVPEGDGWTVPAFGAVVKDGKVYGRGSEDNKGAAVGALYALKAIKELNIKLNKRVRIILGCDEESGWQDIAYYKKHEKMPDFGFSPDANYPVINTEKGILQLRLIGKFSSDGAIKIKQLSGGTRPNVVPGSSFAVIDTAIPYDELQAKLNIFAKGNGFEFKLTQTDEGIRLDSIGITCHGAFPQGGRNAACQLILALVHVGVDGEITKMLGTLADKIGMTYDGAGMGVGLTDEVSGPLSMNLGIFNFDGSNFECSLDIRYPITYKESEITTRIEAAVKNTGLSVVRSGGQAPLHLPADHFVVRKLLEVYEKVTGLPGYTITINGGTYARALNNAVAFGTCFPGHEETMHMANEYYPIDELVLGAKIMAHAIVALCSDESFYHN